MAASINPYTFPRGIGPRGKDLTPTFMYRYGDKRPRGIREGVGIKTPEEIAILREGGKRLARILRDVASEAKPGVSTAELDRRAERLIFDSGGAPSFKGYKGKKDPRPYPAAACISVNDEIVHAPPRKNKILKEGDIVGIDIGMWWPRAARTINYTKKSLCTDTAITVGVGRISKDAERLLKATQEALDMGIAEVRPGVTTGDIGYVIEKYLTKCRLGIVRSLAGHGVGYEIHEEPLIPNFGKRGEGTELKEGMVIAIEPMTTLGAEELVLGDDGWTYRSKDHSLTAHFEHTMAVTAKGAEVLT